MSAAVGMPISLPGDGYGYMTAVPDYRHGYATYDAGARHGWLPGNQQAMPGAVSPHNHVAMATGDCRQSPCVSARYYDDRQTAYGGHPAQQQTVPAYYQQQHWNSHCVGERQPEVVSDVLRSRVMTSLDVTATAATSRCGGGGLDADGPSRHLTTDAISRHACNTSPELAITQQETTGRYPASTYGSGDVIGSDVTYHSLAVCHPCDTTTTSLLSSSGLATHHQTSVVCGRHEDAEEWMTDMRISGSDAMPDVNANYLFELPAAQHAAPKEKILNPVTDTVVDSVHHTMTSRRRQRTRQPRRHPASADRTPSEEMPAFATDAERRHWERERIKKEKHNRIERRRRFNINDHIQMLGSLLPNQQFSGHKLQQNKGSILKASVAYIRLLQQDQARLITVEQRTHRLDTVNRQIIARLKELEALLKASGSPLAAGTSDYAAMLLDSAYVKEEPSSSSVEPNRTVDDGSPVLRTPI